MILLPILLMPIGVIVSVTLKSVDVTPSDGQFWVIFFCLVATLIIGGCMKK